METTVAKFCELRDRKTLFDYVSAKTPISFEKSNSVLWGSQTINGETKIFWADSKHPEACLCHELLHAKLKIDGYKQYVTAICRTNKQGGIANLLGALDNELPHHAFYSQFKALGFSASEMYQDDDTETYQYLKEEIAKLEGAESPMENYFYALISTIAPGGCMEEAQRNELLSLLEQKAPKRFWKRLTSIKKAMTSFAMNGDLDAGSTIAGILYSLGDYDPTWISFQKDEFPAYGHFVGAAFTEEDVLSGRV